MKNCIKVFFCLIIVVNLFACTNDQQNIVVSPNPTYTGETVTEIPATDKPNDLYYSEKHFVVFDSFILGGYFNEKWMSIKDAVKMIKGGEQFKIYSFNKYLGEARGSKPIMPSVNNGAILEIKSDYKEKGPLLSISGKWNALPGSMKKQFLLNKIDNISILNILKKNGINVNELKNIQSYNIDIDSDGKNEKLISAQNVYTLLGASQKKNTYSIIAYKKNIDGKQNWILVKKFFSLKNSLDDLSYIYGISAIADVNGDGQMEIIISNKYYEGNFYDLIKLSASDYKIISTNGFGS